MPASLVIMAVTIKLEHNAVTHVHRFNTDQKVGEIIMSIVNKEKADFAYDFKELGVYQPADGMRPGRWLRLDKTLEYYDLKNNVRQRETFLHELALIFPAGSCSYQEARSPAKVAND